MCLRPEIHMDQQIHGSWPMTDLFPTAIEMHLEITFPGIPNLSTVK